MPFPTNYFVIEQKVHVQNLKNRELKQANILQKRLLNVPLIKQNPELKYGCEVTSLTMMLQYAGVKINKMELYRKIKKDPDPLVRSQTGIFYNGGTRKLALLVT